MYGDKRPIFAKWSSGANMNMEEGWEGLIPQSERLYKSTDSDYRRRMLEKFQRSKTCPSCEGKRLKGKILSIKILDKNIVNVTEMSIGKCAEFFENLKLSDKEM